jgi:hypothetical protein
LNTPIISQLGLKPDVLHDETVQALKAADINYGAAHPFIKMSQVNDELWMQAQALCKKDIKAAHPAMVMIGFLRPPAPHSVLARRSARRRGARPSRTGKAPQSAYDNLHNLGLVA